MLLPSECVLNAYTTMFDVECDMIDQGIDPRTGEVLDEVKRRDVLRVYDRRQAGNRILEDMIKYDISLDDLVDAYEALMSDIEIDKIDKEMQE